jgi:hypothetical protein
MPLNTDAPIAPGKEDAPFSSDPRVIYLAPRCCYVEGEGRLWCEDNVWPCDDCPDRTKARVAKYILGDQIPGPGHEDRAEWDADNRSD